MVGEAGVGKSPGSPGSSYGHTAPRAGCVLERVVLGKATPYLPVIELLKGYCRIQERDEPRAIRERVVGKLLTLDRALERLQAPLLALLDVPVDDSAWDALDRAQRRQRTLDGVKQLLLRESQVSHCSLLFEDTHWMDSETQAVPRRADRAPPDSARILLLVTYRPEYEHAWGHKAATRSCGSTRCPRKRRDAPHDAGRRRGFRGSLEGLARV